MHYKLLYKPISSVKGITEEQFNAIIDKYPLAGKLYEVVSLFKQIMFSKKPEELISWMQLVESLEIDELNTFVKGLKSDIIAVKNAIALEYNNGLADGSVNKIKVIKRIMYGRNKFNLLRNKVLLIESRKINQVWKKPSNSPRIYKDRGYDIIMGSNMKLNIFGRINSMNIKMNLSKKTTFRSGEIY